MAGFDPTKKAQKWANRMQGSSQDYIDGVNAVDTAPGQLAVQHQDAMLQRFTAAVQSGQWAQATGSYPLSQWKQQSTTIGAPRLADGTKKGQPKVQKFLAAAKPVYDQIRTEVRAMPNATDAQREARYQRAKALMKTLKGISKQ